MFFQFFDIYHTVSTTFIFDRDFNPTGGDNHQMEEGRQKVGNVALGIHKGVEILSCQMKIVITVRWVLFEEQERMRTYDIILIMMRCFRYFIFDLFNY